MSWRELGMIHVLVVSGGHLSVLAIFVRFVLSWTILAALSRTQIPNHKLKQLGNLLTLLALTWLALANRLEPPVLRAWLDFIIRPKLKRHGYQGQESGLAATWLALPAVDSSSDFLSLGLSFFASTLLETVGRRLHHRPWLAALTLQATLWWALLPLLLPLGLPHPVATLSNLLLAPIIGGLLIPLALLHHVVSLHGVHWLSEPFAWTWSMTKRSVDMLGQYAPDLAPRVSISDSQSQIAMAALVALAMALTLRQAPRGRKAQSLRPIRWPIGISMALIFSASLLHEGLKNNGSPKRLPQHPQKVIGPEQPKRGKVCIPYRAIERPARSKYCRRKH